MTNSHDKNQHSHESLLVMVRALAERQDSLEKTLEEKNAVTQDLVQKNKHLAEENKKLIDQNKKLFEQNKKLIEEKNTLIQAIAEQDAEIRSLRETLRWFKREIFGKKSEKRVQPVPPEQLSLDFSLLGEEDLTLQAMLDRKLAAGQTPQAAEYAIPLPPEAEQPTAQTSKKPSRRGRLRCGDLEPDDSDLFFDKNKVPVREVVMLDPLVQQLSPDQYSVIGEKITYRIAQQPGSYIILKYRRQVIKYRGKKSDLNKTNACDTGDTHAEPLNSTNIVNAASRGAVTCLPAPPGIFDRCRADVSFIVGAIVDKFVYHQPLYRQHQRLTTCGINVSRGWLSDITKQAISLLEPIYQAQLASIRTSRVKTMDETPLRAGRTAPGKMRQAYVWPVYGQQHQEIAFLYFPDRSAQNVRDALGNDPPPNAVLQTDGYTVYESYCKKLGLLNAQCWAHTRRNFFEASHIEPTLVDQALALIGKLYHIESQIRSNKLSGQALVDYRQTHAKPLAETFFEWLDAQMRSKNHIPSSPFLKAVRYALDRRDGLMIYLQDADVAIDTNHLERELRVVPMGRKNWMFCWTELGGHHLGVIQSLLVTCKLHGIDPYTYLIDVLQRISLVPASQVHLLTPRLWREKFANHPLDSDISYLRNAA